jgi:hypothetical protein
MKNPKKLIFFYFYTLQIIVSMFHLTIKYFYFDDTISKKYKKMEKVGKSWKKLERP